MNLPPFTSSHQFSGSSEYIVVADLREKNSTLSLFGGSDDALQTTNYNTKDFGNFSEILNDFLSKIPTKNGLSVVVCVPGPVVDGKSEPQRLPWTLDEERLKSDCQLSAVLLLNDLEAYAYGLPSVSDESLQTIFQADSSKGNLAILAAGNGLGEAGVFFDGKEMHPFATEGGHCEFSPRTETEVEFYQFLKNIYGIVSWESVLSKTGVFNIYRFLRDVKRHPSCPALDSANGDMDVFIQKLAENSQEQICTITINTYTEFLAREANSLVLKMKATGGLFIGGDVPILFGKFITKEKFYDKFLMSDKMENLLKGISIHLISDQKMVEKGALSFAKICFK